MNERDTLARLRDLRRLRERRARETVGRRHAALAQAMRTARQASDAAEAQAAEAAATEHAMLAALTGRPVTLHELDRVRDHGEIASEEQARLRRQEDEARAAEHERGKELARARETLLKHERAAAKLDGALDETASRTAYRRAALAELVEDEDVPAGTHDASET